MALLLIIAGTNIFFPDTSDTELIFYDFQDGQGMHTFLFYLFILYLLFSGDSLRCV